MKNWNFILFKTVFSVKQLWSYDNADLSDIIVSHDRYIPTVDHFSYLGSIISTNCTKYNDVEARIRKAGSAFGALAKSIFSSPYVNQKVKAMVYTSLILPIPLYGSICWCLTEQLLCKLRTFHHECVRKMCNVTRLHIRILHIKTTDLLESLLLDPIDLYICKCQLRRAGHVFRMPWNCLPRKMLTSWVHSPRPWRCLKMTYDQSLKKSLKKVWDKHWNMAQTSFRSYCMEKWNRKFESELVFIFLYLFWQFIVFSSFFVFFLYVSLVLWSLKVHCKTYYHYSEGICLPVCLSVYLCLSVCLSTIPNQVK